jgi:hypothetical protein
VGVAKAIPSASGGTGRAPKGAPAGYSGKSVAEKLGYKAGTKVLVVGKPKGFATSLAGPDVKVATSGRGPFAGAHVFATERARLSAELRRVLRLIERDGMIWVSWPKKAAKVPTDVTEDTVREVALPMGLVDVKVCAVDEVWSGLKLVIRKERL